MVLKPARASLALSLVISCARSSPGDDYTTDATVTEGEPGLFAQAAISRDSAVAIAKSQAQGRIIKAELEREGGALVYSFEIRVPGEIAVAKISIDARTGTVVK